MIPRFRALACQTIVRPIAEDVWNSIRMPKPNARGLPRVSRSALFAGLLTVGLSMINLTAAYAHDRDELSGKTIVIIGATARTANYMIPQALWRGHEVVAVARRPYRVRHKPHPRLTIVKGDVYDQASIEAALSGRGDEIVISVYGPRVDPTVEVPETDLMSQGTKNIINAMRAKGNKRLFVTTSTAMQEVVKRGYKADTPKPEGISGASGLWYYNLRGPYNDMLKMEGIVKESGLEFIIFRPAQLMEEPPRGNLLLTVNTETPNRRVIMYPDFAAVMLDQVDSDRYLGDIIGVYSETTMDQVENVDFESAVKKLKAIKAEVDADLAAEAAADKAR
jgi:putative NADH-flavin reductase